MAVIPLAFGLLFVAAGVFYGGVALRRSDQGRARLRHLLDDHPKLVGGLLLGAIFALVALGVIAVVYGAKGIG